MSRLRKCTVLAVSLTGLLALTLAASSWADAGEQPSKAQLPGGSWTFRARPFVRPGYDSIPVFAWSVTTDSADGLSLKKVGLLNRARAEVKAVKLTWVLTEAASPDAILQKGETPLITLPKPLATGERAEVRHPLVAFKDIYRPLLKDGRLAGDYLIDVIVTEVSYADEARWALDDVARVAFVKASTAAPLLPLVLQNDCRFDECDYGGGGPCGQTRYNLNCLVCGPSCTTYSCYGGQPMCDQ